MFSRTRDCAENENRKALVVPVSSCGQARARSTFRSSSQDVVSGARRRSRRGVLLLVVLSLLVLFLMLGTAFIITAKQSERAAKASMHGAMRTSAAAARGDLLDEVILQVVRDTNNPASALRFHSLLGDIYGNDGLKTSVASADWASASGGSDETGGQMIELRLDETSVRDGYGNEIDAYGNPYVGGALRLGPNDNAYNGQVLTFLTGIAAGRSTRIVGFVPPNRLRIMNFELTSGALIGSSTFANLQGSAILINGRPFNGTGIGLNPWAGAGAPKLNAEEEVPGGLGRFPLALLPNAQCMFPTNIKLPTNSAAPPGASYFPSPSNALGVWDYNGRGGADESYDVADFQNMPLAFVPAPRPPASLVETVLSDADASLPTNLGTMIIPSWHRPELINYWANQTPFASGADGARSSTLATAPHMLRRVLMRPNWFDHPNFTGSNPEFAAIYGTTPQDHGRRLVRMIYGPWDVDNDNDGVRDSVWIDVGLPVTEGPNGKLVKPLAAMLIVDLDGRLNVNTAGTGDLAEAWIGMGRSKLPPGAPLAGGEVTSDQTARGFGYGPAEISLRAALGASSFQALLTGKEIDGQSYPGRYGVDDNNPARPGHENFQDHLSQVARFGWPRWATGANVLSSFAHPPDVGARYGVGLNDFGQAIFDATLQYARSPSDDLAVDSPYELNLGEKGSAGVNSFSLDSPYCFSELERVLRMYDADAGSLPLRLAYLAGILFPGGSGNLSNRLQITTESRDLPVPNIALPREMEAMMSTNPQHCRLPRSTAELIEVRVRKALNLRPFPEPLDNLGTTKVQEVLRRILAPELANGQRLNVNRALGNGRDDNDNGVVDEPGEMGKVWELQSGGLASAALDAFGYPTFPAMAMEIVPDAGNPDGVLAFADHRQLMARHLYVLALTLTADESFGASTIPTNEEKELVRRLAQWAVNAVDFRDADNIMTAFEYDVNPFNGWDVDGWPGDASPGPDAQIGTIDDVTPSPDNGRPFRGLVWGAERPELIMTETLAWHDRRTDDSIHENVFPDESQAELMKTPNFPNDPDADKDFDQLVRPRGAFFAELYNPWAPCPAANADTHDCTTNPNYDLGVDLGATVGAGADQSPVWRIAVYKRNGVPEPEAAKWDPDDHDKNLRPKGNMDRSIYFVPRLPRDTSDGIAFHNEQRNPTPPVRPGRFLVVGSGDETAPGIYTTPIGDRKKGGAERITRRIELIIRRASQGHAHAVRILDAHADPDVAVIDDQTGLKMRAAADDGVYAERVPGDNAVVQSISDVAIIDRADDGSGPSGRRLTLSEPATGYPDRFRGAKWDDDLQRYMANDSGTAIDVPLDGPLGGEAALTTQFGEMENWPSYLAEFDEGARKWVSKVDPALTSIRAESPHDDAGAYYSHLYLQRLANPLLPWNPEPDHPDHSATRPVNPYLTVDSMPVNLTVFNSRGDDHGLEEPDEENPDGKSSSEPGSFFASTERGGTAVRQNSDSALAGNFVPSLWSCEPPNWQQSPPNDEAALDMLFVAQVPETYRRMALRNENDFWFNAVPYCSLGFLNRPYHDPILSSAMEARKIKPRKPFEWITWNNRPYVSGNELIIVPRCRSSQLFRQFANAETPVDDWSVYKHSPNDSPKPKPGPQKTLPFAHLENFFLEDANGASGVPVHLYRVLEFVHTPSLFVSGETWMNPSSTRFGAPLTLTTASTDPRINYRAPFNVVSEYRDPGQININTLPGEYVWDALFHGAPDRSGSDAHPGPEYGDYVTSLSAFGEDGLELNDSYPTTFANPFRSPDAGNLVPIVQMQRAGVDLTLLRSFEGSAGAAAAPKGEPMFATTMSEPFNDSKRNPYFRYQPIARLDNLLTTRSNVYAAWVTVGFFEVIPAPTVEEFTANSPGLSTAEAHALFRRVYPDGYQLDREAGVETGDICRLRSFYIIDRTIPVGFEQGVNHNVENVIRLRRRIQ